MFLRRVRNYTKEERYSKRRADPDPWRSGVGAGSHVLVQVPGVRGKKRDKKKAGRGVVDRFLLPTEDNFSLSHPPFLLQDLFHTVHGRPNRPRARPPLPPSPSHLSLSLVLESLNHLTPPPNGSDVIRTGVTRVRWFRFKFFSASTRMKRNKIRSPLLRIFK
jgi:hypothetical protein